MRKLTTRFCLVVALLIGTTVSARGQHTETPASGFERILYDMFDFFLVERLNLGEGFHASHYIPAATIAQQTLAPALSNHVASNVASVPLSATQVGIVLDFSTGVPVKVIDRQGPIFAETGQTLGRNNFSAGINYTHLNLNRFRGLALDDLSFTFVHQDFAGDGGDGTIGDQETERDLVIVRPHLELTAGILAIYASYGILDNLDIGVAFPIVSMQARGVAEATVESWTLEHTGLARHFLGGTPENPVLDATYRYDEAETSLNAIALQAKYQFPFDGWFESAALLDVRIPTGNSGRLLGEGATNWYLALIASSSLQVLNPHVNLIYNARGASYDSDRLAYAIGFDRVVVPGVTVALDVLGDVTLNTDQTIRLYDRAQGSSAPVYFEWPGTPRNIPLSNVEDRNHDNRMDLSAGARNAFSPEIQAVVSLMVPLSSGGLYATWVPTAGLTVIL
ncbi:MAG: hypothetical protein ACOCTG_00750 [Bacteroidota bacterium]